MKLSEVLLQVVPKYQIIQKMIQWLQKNSHLTDGQCRDIARNATQIALSDVRQAISKVGIDKKKMEIVLEEMGIATITYRVTPYSNIKTYSIKDLIDALADSVEDWVVRG